MIEQNNTQNYEIMVIINVVIMLIDIVIMLINIVIMLINIVIMLIYRVSIYNLIAYKQVSKYRIVIVK